MSIDFRNLAEPVARCLLGEPNKALSIKSQLRFGTKGSLAVDLTTGTWYDHERKEGGGVLELIKKEGHANPIAWLREQHLIQHDTLVATFDYRDEQGKLLFQVCRTAGKRFYQRRPNGHGGWVNNLKGVRRVLYHLPELLKETGPVFIPEGEKHVDALCAWGLRATCNAGGAGKWDPEYCERLRGQDVVLLPDNDDPGRAHVQKVAIALRGVAARVRVLLLPNLNPKGDIINWMEAGGTKDELLRLVDVAADWKPEDNPEPDKSDEPEYKKQRLNQAKLLLALASSAELFHTPDGLGFADLNIKGHRETWPIRSRTFRQWLARLYYKKTGGAPNNDARQQALNIIEAQANFDAVERPISVRVASLDGKIYLDLCDVSWRAIEISTEGWQLVSKSPVRFRRSGGMLPLPAPTCGGDVNSLRELLNVQSNADFTLVIAWTLAALRGSGPYPILVVAGEQGSAKSTLASMIRRLVDPNTALLRALPREERDLFIAANNAHVLAYDNISGLQPWISDALCRLSTGGGFATRELHTDQDEILFDAVRPSILNGIEDVVTRPDLADRAIMLTLLPISDDKRCTEAEIWKEFDAVHPAVLGALLDGVAHGLRTLPDVKLARRPRMADFAIWATACEPALDLKCTFDIAYSENRDQATETVIDADPVALAVRELAQRMPAWEGTATKLLDHLGWIAGETVTRGRHWPGAAHILSRRLRRAATFLRKVGIEINLDSARKGRASDKIIKITAIAQGELPLQPARAPTSEDDIPY